MVGTLFFPLLRSFEHRINYVSKWKYLWPGILVSGVFFIAWDVYFTHLGVWAFNPDYVIGAWIFGLPIEEWLFFICVPFSCVFIYESVKYYMSENVGQKWGVPVALLLAALCLGIAAFHTDKWYTSVKLGSTGIFLLLHVWIFGNQRIGAFLVSFLFVLIPFVLVNGTLTYLPVVTYNDAENLGIRINDLVPVPFFNIPIEDSMYGLTMLLITVSIYEALQNPQLLKQTGVKPSLKTSQTTPLRP